MWYTLGACVPPACRVFAPSFSSCLVAAARPFLLRGRWPARRGGVSAGLRLGCFVRCGGSVCAFVWVWLCCCWFTSCRVLCSLLACTAASPSITVTPHHFKFTIMYIIIFLYGRVCVRLFLRAFEAAGRFALRWLSDPAQNGRPHVSDVSGHLSVTNNFHNVSSAGCIRVGNVCFQVYIVFGGAICVLTESYCSSDSV